MIPEKGHYIVDAPEYTANGSLDEPKGEEDGAPPLDDETLVVVEEVDIVRCACGSDEGCK